jgi:hypothetical protein
MYLLGWGVPMSLGLGQWMVRQGFARRTNGGAENHGGKPGGRAGDRGDGRGGYDASRGALSTTLPESRP